jgi:hypothetical protein
MAFFRKFSTVICRVCVYGYIGAMASLSFALTPPVAKTVALMAVVGDQISFVRERMPMGHTDRTFRKTVDLRGDGAQAINVSILKGLDKALKKENPLTNNVFLLWRMPADLRESWNEKKGCDKDGALLEAILSYLQQVPQRKDWDQIELVVPRYYQNDRDGIGRKLGGVGIYVQPLEKATVEFEENGDMSLTDKDGDDTTINPNTGARSNASTYVAPFFYVERITIDAKTLEILGRKSSFDNVKYNDPTAATLDVGDQMTMKDMLTKLNALAEKAAYRSIRGVRPEVEVGPLTPATK